MNQIVSYVRVSTQRQGVSGLGLDAQRSAIAEYCKAQGVKVSREFREVESGKNNDRAVLREALAHAKRLHTTLVIGKLDRLARNVAFISNLMESGVEFVACDVPEANRLLLHIMAAVAENEARAISDRTIAALAAARSRGTALGATNPKSRNLDDVARAKGTKLGSRAMKEKASAYYAEVEPKIRALRKAGMSFAKIADALTGEGHVLRSGKPWNAMQVRRVIERG